MSAHFLTISDDEGSLVKAMLRTLRKKFAALTGRHHFFSKSQRPGSDRRLIRAMSRTEEGLKQSLEVKRIGMRHRLAAIEAEPSGFNLSSSPVKRPSAGGSADSARSTAASAPEAPVVPVASKSAASTAAIVGALRMHFLFAGLGAREMTALIAAMVRVEVLPGEVVIAQGEAGDRFYVVERGAFDVFVQAEAKDAKDAKGTKRDRGGGQGVRSSEGGRRRRMAHADGAL